MQCVKGLPDEVQKALISVVGLQKMAYKLWVENLDHHKRQYLAHKVQEGDELKALSKRLQHCQVAEKNEAVNRNKNKAKQMIATPPEGNWQRK